MARSQNAVFHGAEPKPNSDHIGGVSIAHLLATRLSARGWSVGDLDCWRDGGWMFTVTRNDESLHVVLAPYSGANSWMLQIAAARFPLIIARWFGATPSATSDAVFQLATDAHTILSDSGLTAFRWCWDGPADTDDCACEPQPAAARQFRI